MLFLPVLEIFLTRPGGPYAGVSFSRSQGPVNRLWRCRSRFARNAPLGAIDADILAHDVLDGFHCGANGHEIQAKG